MRTRETSGNHKERPSVSARAFSSRPGAFLFSSATRLRKWLYRRSGGAYPSERTFDGDTGQTVSIAPSDPLKIDGSDLVNRVEQTS